MLDWLRLFRLRLFRLRLLRISNEFLQSESI